MPVRIGNRPFPLKSAVAAVLLLAVAGQILAGAGAGGSAVLLGFSYLAFLLRGIIWSVVLHVRPVAAVYPLLALSYPLVLLADHLLFGEHVGTGNIAGTLLICAGTALLIPESAK